MKKPIIDELKSEVTFSVDECTISSIRKRLIYKIVACRGKTDKFILTVWSDTEDYVSFNEPDGTISGNFCSYNDKDFRDWIVKFVTDKITKQLNKGGK